MKDKTEKNISLIDLPQNQLRHRINNNNQIEKKQNYSRYAPIRDKIEWPFDYEVNKIRFDTLNRNKLYFIRDKNDKECYESNNIYNLIKFRIS